MLKYALFFVAIVILSFGGFVAYHVGAMKPVLISEEDRPEMHGLYMNYVGPYHKTVSVIEKIESWAKENKVDCHLSYGEYLQDPQNVEEARLKSRGGCLVKDLPWKMPEDFHTMVYAKRHYVVATFDGAPGIGPLKVYPKVAEYLKEKSLQQSGPVMEVYEIHTRAETASMTTTYLFPVEKRIETLKVKALLQPTAPAKTAPSTSHLPPEEPAAAKTAPPVASPESTTTH
jgi:AraC family transcriptional regulator